MEQEPSTRIWPQLPPELAERIAAFLCPNEVAGSLRLVNKAAAGQFRGPQHTIIHLSQSVPPDAFARHWGAPGASQGLNLKQRRRLLCLTASSGSIPNLEVAIKATGCLPEARVLQAAAAARQLAVCEWLLQRECFSDGEIWAAARAGHRDVIEWLLAHRDSSGIKTAHASTLKDQAASAAAWGGHVDLVEWLVEGRTPEQSSIIDITESAADGCDLAALQRVYGMWLGRAQGGVGWPLEAGAGQQQLYGHCTWRSVQERVLRGAAGSPTPDWRAKVEWLEERGHVRTSCACSYAAARPDAIDRLTWLRQRGYRVDIYSAAEAAALAGNLQAVQYLWESYVPPDAEEEEDPEWGAAIELGSAAKVAAEAAAESGHLSVLVWLVESGHLRRYSGIMQSAARGGSVEVLTWLHERGIGRLDAAIFPAAARAGSEEALEWLVQRGCSMQGSHAAYLEACANGDLATLSCLRRLGCPWGPVGWVFEAAIRFDCQAGVLRWLLEAGCPVDVEKAEAELRQAGSYWGCWRSGGFGSCRYRERSDGLPCSGSWHL